MDKRGNVTLLAAAAMPVILLTGIFATDAARIWLTRARLQAAADAGALLIARDINAANRDANGRAVVANNYNNNAGNSPQLNPADVQITSIGTDQVKVQASVGMTPTLSVPRFFGAAIFNGNYNVTASSTANRTSTGLELALVFDITLSMTASDVGNGKTRIKAAADAGTTLLRILYGDSGTDASKHKKWVENLFISVVPFATAVNIGRDNEHFLGAARPHEMYRLSWNGTTPSWGGCVEMRDLAHGDASPRTAGLTRFFARSTYDPTKLHDPKKSNTAGAQPHCLAEAAYKDSRKNNPSGANNVCMGHNDWTAPAYLFSGANGQEAKQNTLIQTMVAWDSHQKATIDPWVEAHGPNMMCPPQTHQVLPLTRDRATVQALIDKIGTVTDLPFSAGTNIAPGLMAGWFTLSPKWRKVENVFNGWPSREPAATSGDPRPALPPLPFDYLAQNRRKVLILLTDGDNTWFNAENFQGSSSAKLVRPESRGEEGFYGAYGNLRDHFGSTNDTISKGVQRINAEAVKWCKAIRGWPDPAATTPPTGPEQITVYTISFSGSVSQPARDLLAGCASKRADGTAQYWHAPDDATLQRVFQAIGAELSNLRLTQ